MATLEVSGEEIVGGEESSSLPLLSCLATPTPFTDLHQASLGGSCEGDGLAPTCVGKDRLLGVSGRTSVASSFAPTAETQDTRVIAHGA